MAIPEDSDRKLKELFPKSKEEFEDEVNSYSGDTWPVMDDHDMPHLGSDENESSGEVPFTLSEKEPPSIPFDNEPPSVLSEKRPTVTLLFSNEPPRKRAGRRDWSFPWNDRPRTIFPHFSGTTEEYISPWVPTREFDAKSFPPIDFIHEPKYPVIPEGIFEIKDPRAPIPSNLQSSTDMKAYFGLVGLAAALLLISKLRSRKNRNNTGVLPGFRDRPGQQSLQTNRRTSPESGEAGPETSDLLPSYQECVEDQKQQSQAFVENERLAFLDVAPDVRTEIVFDNGPIVERVCSDANNKTDAKETNNDADNAETQSTIDEGNKDIVVHVDVHRNVER